MRNWKRVRLAEVERPCVPLTDFRKDIEEVLRYLNLKMAETGWRVFTARVDTLWAWGWNKDEKNSIWIEAWQGGVVLLQDVRVKTNLGNGDRYVYRSLTRGEDNMNGCFDPDQARKYRMDLLGIKTHLLAEVNGIDSSLELNIGLT